MKVLIKGKTTKKFNYIINFKVHINQILFAVIHYTIQTKEMIT